MNLQSLLERPITIEGRQVILIEDHVGEVSMADTAAQRYSLLELAGTSASLILVDEDRVLQARERFPDMPVYGLWQTLIHSRVLSVEDQFQILPENEGDGAFIVLDPEEERFTLSGRYSGQLFAPFPDLLVGDCRIVDFPLDRLRLPASEARTKKEMAAIRAQEERRFLLAGGLVAGALIVGGLLVDFTLGRLHSSAVIEHQGLQQALAERVSVLDTLKTTRLAEFPRYDSTLDRLDHLLLIDNGFTFPSAAQSSFAAENISVEVNAPHFTVQDIREQMPWAAVFYQPSGKYVVSFTVEKQR